MPAAQSRNADDADGHDIYDFFTAKAQRRYHNSPCSPFLLVLLAKKPWMPAAQTWNADDADGHDL